MLWQALQDPRYQQTAAAYFAKAELPQPIDLEVDELLRQKASPMEKVMRTLAVYAPSIAKRSFWTARTLEYLGNMYERIHYVCGQLHATQIEYFMKNPHYRIPDFTTRLVKP